MSKNSRFRLALVALGLVFATSTTIAAQDHDHDHDHSQAEKSGHQESPGEPYLLGTDAVSGKALGAIDKQVILMHEGRELRFSGNETAVAFRADPAKALAAVDKKMIAQQMPFYPLETCVVSGEKLGGEMGDAIDVIHKNRLIRLCCKGCKKQLAKDPAGLIAKLDKAVVAQQMKAYPLATCVVSGEKLGGEMGEPIDYVVGNRLVRLCCKGCKKNVAKDPISYLARLDGSAEHGRGDHGGHGGHGDGHGDGDGHHDGQR